MSSKGWAAFTFSSTWAWVCLLTLGCGKVENPQAVAVATSADSAQGPTAVIAEWVKASDQLSYRSLAKPIADASEGTTTRFERVPAKLSGLSFVNQLKFENFHQNYYLVAGSGVTVGDYDDDGLPDVFMAGQDAGSRLFRQTEPWVFEDVTESAGLPLEDGWASGTAFADMDGDGDLDLFVCYRGSSNRYYINLGNGKFRGTEFALDAPDRTAPTMVAVMDADLDGNLDAYLVGNRLQRWQEKFQYRLKFNKDDQGLRVPAPGYERDVMFVNGRHLVELGTKDHLLLNPDPKRDQVPRFKLAKDQEMGLIGDLSLGLAATWFDGDNDRQPDLYVSNDFEGPDHFYLAKSGKFVESTGDSLAATSLYSMGADYGDLNNDGWLDLITADMSNTTHFKSKVMMGDMNNLGWLLDWAEPRQAMRNFVHINAGTGEFLESAFYSHLSSTDWTWTVLCADLDLDGREDVFFTNGLYRNLQDADFSDELKRLQQEDAGLEAIAELCRKQPLFAEKNLCYRNQGNLIFEECGEQWGLGESGISHGAVMADFDRDGDLDLIVNNQNEQASLYRNTTDSGARVLISLRGRESNFHGLGARVVIQADGLKQTRYISSSRGYCSGTEPIAHFGVGESKQIDQLTVYWPSGKTQSFEDLAVGRHYRISESEGSQQETNPQGPSQAAETPLFAEQDSSSLGIDFEHAENAHNDFAVQPLLPNQISKMGPALATGDVNQDGLADFYVGGARGQAGALYLQSKDGTFRRLASELFEEDSQFEDTGAVLFDADGDQDLDLYVVSGGNFAKLPDEEAGDGEDAEEAANEFQDRLYVNQGDGSWSKAALPRIAQSGQVVAASDFDQDGDQDLFVGGRIVPHQYPGNPGSLLLINDGGTFEVQSPPGFEQSGMITDAVWTDTNGDGWQDLVVTVEWGSVRLWQNDQGVLTETTAVAGLADSLGWWMSLAAGDFDNDGDQDLFVGNWGLNSKYKASRDYPVSLYAGDFGDGNIQLVESWTKQGKTVPVRGLSCSSNAMPFIKKRFNTYRAFASASLEELYTPTCLDSAATLQVNTLASSVFLNDGKGNFNRADAPPLAQLAPVMSVDTTDVNGDGVIDCLLAQNNFTPQRETGRANGGLCLLLQGMGDGSFEAIWPNQSGVHVRVDTRNSAVFDMNQDGQQDWLIVPNGDRPRVLYRTSQQTAPNYQRAEAEVRPLAAVQK